MRYLDQLTPEEHALRKLKSYPCRACKRTVLFSKDEKRVDPERGEIFLPCLCGARLRLGWCGTQGLLAGVKPVPDAGSRGEGAR